MKKQYVVALSWSACFAFNNIKDATALIEAASKGKSVDEKYHNGSNFVEAESSQIRIIETDVLTSPEFVDLATKDAEPTEA